MKKAAYTGAITALGFFLAVWAAMSKPKLDWVEVALIAGISLISVGISKASEILKNIQ